MALKNSDGKIISSPAGINDKIDVVAIGCEKIEEKQGKAEKLAATTSKEYQGVRTTDLTLGSTVKAYNDNEIKQERKNTSIDSRE